MFLRAKDVNYEVDEWVKGKLDTVFRLGGIDMSLLKI